MLLTMEFISKFPVARYSEWFKRSMEYLESFETEKGTYIFPRKWLSEKKTGYWVGGIRMMIDDRKGHANAIECESTFHMLRIKQATEESK